jgi:membrane protein DedA with SNARE-associated domain
MLHVAIAHFFTHHGFPLLLLVVLLESFGIPLPGETALIAFGVPAAQTAAARCSSAGSSRSFATPSPGSPDCRGGAGRRSPSWSAAGGIAWATLVGLLAYYGGQAAADALTRYGVYAAFAFALGGGAGWLLLRRARRRRGSAVVIAGGR